MAETTQGHAPGHHPDLPPPVATVGAIGWLRRNLFSSWYNTLLTVLALYLVYLVIPPFLQWALFDAYWSGSTREACFTEVDGRPQRLGACWVFIKVWFYQFIYGFYPDVERWRVNVAFLILIVASAPLFIPAFRWKQWLGLFLLVGYPIIALYLFSGITQASIADWPYRMVAFATLALAVVASLPLFGVLRRYAGIICVALMVLVPVWGFSIMSTWSADALAAGARGGAEAVSLLGARLAPGLMHGVSNWLLAIAFYLATAPFVVIAFVAHVWGQRGAFREIAWYAFLAVGVLAIVGYTIPLLFRDEGVEPSLPWSLTFATGVLGIASLCPWAYGNPLARMTRWVTLVAYLLVATSVFIGLPEFLAFSSLDWGRGVEPVVGSVAGTLSFVETDKWGGLFLTLVIAGVGIVMSLPIGVVLALGRRSEMPIVRAICVAFIELWRGVPLITVLFMASVMFPLFVPEEFDVNKLLRALIGVMLFSAAYMAEVVRGGLQAIPKGQYEGAQALGLGYWQMMGLIVLPQALKMVIPGIVNTFIGLFKDTTLVLVISLFDFLNMVKLAGTNPNWLGFAIEGYVFAAVVFWLFCFGMSRYSLRIERKLHTGHRR